MRRKDDGNTYKVSMVEASSPLTTRPSTPFRVSALGVMEIEVCDSKRSTTSSPLISKASDTAVVIHKPLDGCVENPPSQENPPSDSSELCRIEHPGVLVYVGQVSNVGLDVDAVTITYSMDDQTVARVFRFNDRSVDIMGVKTGTTKVNITHTYEDGTVCITTALVEVFERGAI